MRKIPQKVKRIRLYQTLTGLSSPAQKSLHLFPGDFVYRSEYALTEGVLRGKHRLAGIFSSHTLRDTDFVYQSHNP